MNSWTAMLTGRCLFLFRRGSFVFAAILVSLWIDTTVMALLVREETSTEEGVLLSPPGIGTSHLCTAMSSTQMVCNPDPLVLYQKAGYSTDPLNGNFVLDLGVKQRIDGNDAEIEGIQQVIKLMNQYFLEEVLSIDEYAFIVPKWYETF
jgi:hypothetical protein